MCYVIYTRKLDLLCSENLHPHGGGVTTHTVHTLHMLYSYYNNNIKVNVSNNIHIIISVYIQAIRICVVYSCLHNTNIYIYIIYMVLKICYT